MLQQNKTLNITDFYEYYTQQVLNPVNSLAFTNTLGDIFMGIRDYLLTGNDYFLPHQLGVFTIRWQARRIKTVEKNGKKIIRGLCIDWGGTIDYYRNTVPELKDAKAPEIRAYIKSLPKGEKVILKHFNEHTDGRVARINYIKEYPGATAKYKSKRFKKFIPTRRFTQALSDVILKNNNVSFNEDIPKYSERLDLKKRNIKIKE